MSDAPTSRQDRIDRSRARGWALQILYRWESGGKEGSLLDALGETLATRRMSPRRLPRVSRLLGAVDEHLDDIDRRLTDALDNWRLERISVIDRGVLRLATAELLHLDEIPPRVALQEAVRLAEQYGGPESPRFVNGVLDALYKRVGTGPTG